MARSPAHRGTARGRDSDADLSRDGAHRMIQEPSHAARPVIIDGGAAGFAAATKADDLELSAVIINVRFKEF